MGGWMEGVSIPRVGGGGGGGSPGRPGVGGRRGVHGAPTYTQDDPQGPLIIWRLAFFSLKSVPPEAGLAAQFVSDRWSLDRPFIKA